MDTYTITIDQHDTGAWFLTKREAEHELRIWGFRYSFDYVTNTFGWVRGIWRDGVFRWQTAAVKREA